MRIWIVVLLCAVALTGCRNGAELDRLKAQNEMLMEQSSQLQRQVQQLQQERDEARQQAQVLKARADDPALSERVTIQEQFPTIGPFLNVQSFQKIEIADGAETYAVTDPAILESVAPLFVIKGRVDTGSPPVADIQPVQYVMTTAAGTVKADLVKLGLLTFPDLYPGQYFRVDNEAYQLAKAFIHQPEYLGEQPTLAKMAESGLIEVKEPENSGVYYSTNRIYAVVRAFLHAEPKEISKPNAVPRNVMNLTFYYYRKTLHMNLYEGMVQVIDQDGERWYQVKEPIYTAITAG